MKILALADHESPWLWDYLDRKRLEGVELILSCGDLDPRYLSFVATFAHAPVLYVHGNHDDRYAQIPPEGCICVEDQIYVHQGVRILGLGGSVRYKREGEHQYTQPFRCSAGAGWISSSPTPPPWGSTTGMTWPTPGSRHLTT